MNAPRSAPTFAARSEGLFVLALGGGLGWLASSASYAALMNPAFRPLTLVGAVLIAGMGLALMLRPSRAPDRGALAVFGALFLLVALGRPAGPGAARLTPPTTGVPEHLARDGYAPIDLGTLFDAASRPQAAQRVVVRGRLHRTTELDAAGEVIVYAPLMSCCLADAVALGVRAVWPASGMTDIASGWPCIFGELRPLPAPVPVPPFAIGPIRLATVSSEFVLHIDEVVDARTLLPSVVALIPADRCGAFLDALRSSGVLQELEGDGPFTLLAPLDAGFLRNAADLKGAGLQRYVRSFVLTERRTRRALTGASELPTLAGRSLRVRAGVGTSSVEGARVLFGDQLGRNGIVHIVHPAWAPDR